LRTPLSVRDQCRRTLDTSFRSFFGRKELGFRQSSLIFSAYRVVLDLGLCRYATQEAATPEGHRKGWQFQQGEHQPHATRRAQADSTNLRKARVSSCSQRGSLVSQREWRKGQEGQIGTQGRRRRRQRKTRKSTDPEGRRSSQGNASSSQGYASFSCTSSGGSRQGCAARWCTLAHWRRLIVQRTAQEGC